MSDETKVTNLADERRKREAFEFCDWSYVEWNEDRKPEPSLSLVDDDSHPISLLIVPDGKQGILMTKDDALRLGRDLIDIVISMDEDRSDEVAP